MLTTIGADQKSMHYTHYDSKKKGSKGGKAKTTQASTSKKPEAKSTKGAYAIPAENLIQKDTMKSAKPNMQNANHANRLDTMLILA